MKLLRCDFPRFVYLFSVFSHHSELSCSYI
ncbi:Protein of unknown function [Gryllus bimaculatus]|nr:Protein of unknown function [Gryllus bimaculatus]